MHNVDNAHDDMLAFEGDDLVQECSMVGGDEGDGGDGAWCMLDWV